MLCPSEILRASLAAVSVGHFYESVIGANGTNIGLVAKLPTEISTALSRGSEAFLRIEPIEIEGRFFIGVALSVFDDPISPFYVCRIYSSSELEEFFAFCRQKTKEFFIFDEVGRFNTSYKCEIDVSETTLQSMKLENHEQVATEQAVLKLNNLLFNNEAKLLKQIPLNLSKLDEPSVVDLRRHKIITDDPNRLQKEFCIGSFDEGIALENRAAIVLTRVFDVVGISPKVMNDNKSTRELTDIVAISNRKLCLIESKAIEIAAAQKVNSQERRIKNVAKNMRKALRQLGGVYRTITESSNQRIYIGDNEIPIGSDFRCYLVILLSDLHPSLGDDILNEIHEFVSRDKRGLSSIHILDFASLDQLTRSSQSSKQFFESLEQQNSLVNIHNTIHIKHYKGCWTMLKWL